MDGLEYWVGRPRPPRESGDYNVFDIRSGQWMCVCWMDLANGNWFYDYYINRYGPHFILFTRRKKHGTG